MNATTPDFTKLSVEERIALIGRIWDTIEAERAVVPLTPAQREVLDQRLDDYEKNPDAGVPWEEAKKQILGGK